MNGRNYKKGFTLAEVLISLTIIGIIAALTIPVVMQSSDQQYYAGYKKALAVGTEALEMQLAYGKYTQMMARGDASAANNFREFSKFLNVQKECFSGNCYDCWDESGEKLYANSQPTAASLAVVDATGMAWALYSNNENILLIDMNGKKGPNEYGKDRWYLVPINDQGIREGSQGPNGKAVSLGPYSPFTDSISEVIDINEYNSGWCQHPPCKIKSGLDH